MKQEFADDDVRMLMKRRFEGAADEQSMLPIYPDAVKAMKKPVTWPKWAGIAAGLGVVGGATALVLGLLVPATHIGVPAPAGAPAEVGQPAEETNAGEAYPVVETVSTEGWATFSDPGIPVTFRYPTDWQAGDLQCLEDGCTLFVNPPDAYMNNAGDGATIELLVNGTENPHAELVSWSEPGVQVLGAVPGQEVLIPGETANGALLVLNDGRDLALGTQRAIGDYIAQVALADPAGQTLQAYEWPASFLFMTNVANLLGDPQKDAAVITTILASVERNPEYSIDKRKYAESEDDGETETSTPLTDAETPKIGEVEPDSTWKTWELANLGLSIQLPADMKAVAGDESEGYSWRLDTLKTIASQEMKEILVWNMDWNDGSWAPDDDTTATSGRPRSSTEHPCGSIELGDVPGLTDAGGAQVSITMDHNDLWTEIMLCANDQSAIDFGNGERFSITSDDNWDPMSAEDRNLIVAILASVKRIG